MKLSAQISTFLVLVAALVGMGIYVNAIDIDTDAPTLQESLLPFTYPDPNRPAATEVRGVSFRYPRGWQLAASGSTINLQRPIERTNPDKGSYALQLAFQQADTDDLASLLESLAPGAQAETTEAGGLPGLRAVQTTSDGLNLTEVVRLNDENFVLALRSTQPFSSAGWDAVQGEIDAMLDSIVVAPDAGLVPNAIVYSTIPEGWGVLQENKYFFIAATPADAAVPTAGVQVIALPAREALAAMGQLLAIPAGKSIADAQTPIDFLRFYEDLPEDSEIPVTSPLTEVEYFGLKGVEVGIASPSLGDIHYMALDGEDDYYVLVLTQISDEANAQELRAKIEEILAGVTYNTPDPSFYQQ